MAQPRAAQPGTTVTPTIETVAAAHLRRLVASGDDLLRKGHAARCVPWPGQPVTSTSSAHVALCRLRLEALAQAGLTEPQQPEPPQGGQQSKQGGGERTSKMCALHFATDAALADCRRLCAREQAGALVDMRVALRQIKVCALIGGGGAPHKGAGDAQSDAPGEALAPGGAGVGTLPPPTGAPVTAGAATAAAAAAAAASAPAAAVVAADSGGGWSQRLRQASAQAEVAESIAASTAQSAWERSTRLEVRRRQRLDGARYAGD
jgi:hypothetical protein